MLRSKPVLSLVIAIAWLLSFLASFYLIVIGFMMVVTSPTILHLGIDAFFDDTKDNIASLFDFDSYDIHFWRFSLVLAAIQSLSLLAWKRLSNMAPAVVFSATLTGAFLTIAHLFNDPEQTDTAGILAGFIVSGCAGGLATWSLFQFKVIRHRWAQSSDD